MSVVRIMKKGDKLYRVYGYNEVVEGTVLKAGKTVFDIECNGLRHTHNNDAVGVIFFPTREAAEYRRDVVNAAEDFLEELKCFQKVSVNDLARHLSLEEINLRREQAQELFVKAFNVGISLGDTVKVLLPNTFRRNARLRPLDPTNKRGSNYVRSGTLLKVLEVGPYRNANVGLRVALESDPNDVFYVDIRDVGAP